MDDRATVQALASLLDLSRRAREAASQRELGFLLVNDSNSLLPYRQAALWLAPKTVYALSGLVQVEANAPYVQWLNRVCHFLDANSSGGTRAVSADQLPPELAAQWDEWWPAHALWLGWVDPDHGAGALLLLRDEAWPEQSQHLAQEWVRVWQHAFRALDGAGSGLARRLGRFFLGTGRRPGARRWWQRPALLLAAGVLAVLAYPVHMTVLAPGELVPSRPVVVRAPLEGVIDVFHVQPNQSVKKDQPLFGFDEALVQSRIQVAAQTLATARTDYRQTSQQALVDAKVRPQLAVLAGKIEEKRAELEYLRDQLTRSRVLAPKEGVALFDDANEWIGRPVAVGERILRIAEPGDVEVEAWIPIADAIALAPGSAVNLYLNASPLEPVTARLRYTAHEAIQRPDGSYAYRARAVLDGAIAHRVGLKGTAKLQGDKVPLAYWMMRRPLATLRGMLGV
jgi:hypothetical protein